MAYLKALFIRGLLALGEGLTRLVARENRLVFRLVVK